MKCVVKNNSSMDMSPLLPLLKSLLPYSRKKLGFNRPPSLFFASDTENAAKPLGKTAFYDPEGVSITIFVDGRHPKDILRSISHELVHHMQHERGDFGTDMDTGEGYAQKNDALRELEREAYESGNMCFRDWEDENKHALQEAKQHFYRKNKKMSAKKKRNDKIESLLMEKWGLKPLLEEEFIIEVPEPKKEVISEKLVRHIIKEAIARTNKNTIREARAFEYDPDLTAEDLRNQIVDLINRSGDVSMDEIRELGIQLRMGRQHKLDGYELTWETLGNAGMMNLYGNPQNERIQKELAILGMQNWKSGAQKVLGTEEVDDSILKHWFIRSHYINQDGVEEPVVSGYEMLSALENPNKSPELIQQIAERAASATENLEKFSKERSAEIIEPLYNIGAGGERIRAGEEGMGYRGGLSWLPKRAQAAMAAWGDQKKEIEGTPEYQKLNPDEKKAFMNDMFEGFAGKNPEIYKSIQRDYSAPRIESGRGTFGSKLNRALKVGPWDYFFDKPVGIERAEEAKAKLKTAYDKLVDLGKINPTEFSFYQFIDQYNKKVESSILDDISKFSGEEEAGIAQNLAQGIKTQHSLVPTTQAGDLETTVGIRRSLASMEDDSDIPEAGKFWAVVAANPDLMPPDISAGSRQHMEQLQSTFEQEAGKEGFDLDTWIRDQTSQSATEERNQKISEINTDSMIKSLESDYDDKEGYSEEQLQLRKANLDAGEPAWWPHMPEPVMQHDTTEDTADTGEEDTADTGLQEVLIRKVVQEALKRKFGE